LQWPERAFRVIGVVPSACGRALDIALVETDGAALLRRIETGRVPLKAGDGAHPSLVERIAVEILAFMGNRALQPFAVDGVGLGGSAAAVMAGPLATRTGVTVIAVDLVAPLFAAPAGEVAFARAEQAALGAVHALRRRDTTPP
jgi:hypothetical protein